VYYFWVVDVNEDAAPITNQVEDLQNWILVRLSDNWQILALVLGAIVAAAILYVTVRRDDGDESAVAESMVPESPDADSTDESGDRSADGSKPVAPGLPSPE
jgi:hypothetical protein